MIVCQIKCLAVPFTQFIVCMWEFSWGPPPCLIKKAACLRVFRGERYDVLFLWHHMVLGLSVLAVSPLFLGSHGCRECCWLATAGSSVLKCYFPHISYFYPCERVVFTWLEPLIQSTLELDPQVAASLLDSRWHHFKCRAFTAGIWMDGQMIGLFIRSPYTSNYLVIKSPQLLSSPTYTCFSWFMWYCITAWIESYKTLGGKMQGKINSCWPEVCPRLECSLISLLLPFL